MVVCKELAVSDLFRVWASQVEFWTEDLASCLSDLRSL